MFLIKFLLFLYLFNYSKCYSEVCFEDLGCFSNKPPFSGTLGRPVGYVPDEPSKINTTFTLFTRQVENIPISENNLSEFFNSSLPTKLIAHGFVQNSRRKWIIEMKDKLLKIQDSNVILVDYKTGFSYIQGCANARVAGAQIANLIKKLVENFGADLDSFHLIGQSLGAHVVGYAGKRLNKVGRITGLDPAGPLFEFTDPVVRLDLRDAKFVDVIHSNGLKLGFGLLQEIGHVDFYPNGGQSQPSCSSISTDKIINGVWNLISLNVDEIEDIGGCSHVAGLKYFIDSIDNQNCQYTAYPCNSIDDFNEGKCIECSNEGCNKLGYWASPSKDLGKLYLNTQDADKFPFCQQFFQLRLISNNLNGQVQARGKLTVKLFSGSQSTDLILIDDSQISFKPNSNSVFLIPIEKYIDGNIDKLAITYTKTSNLISSWLYDDQWSFQSIQILNGEKQFKSSFCSSEIYLKSGKEFIAYSC